MTLRCVFLTGLAVASAGAQCMGPMMMGGRMGNGGLPAEVASWSNPITKAKTDLGRVLFYDPRISKGGDISCNSCHSLKDYGVDGKPVSTGYRGQTGSRNAPTVYNAAGHIAQFWDGRASSIEEQAKGPILNPVEMAMPSAAAVEAKLKSIAGYEPLFRKAFPGETDPITFDNVARAIGAFERRLLTPSRWDRFLAGDRNAITGLEMAGYVDFMRAGCMSCHNGTYVGGRAFERLGYRRPWPSDADAGRAQVTQDPADRLVFKVPSLRNVAKTAPYFHDGSIASLEEAVHTMGVYQLNRDLAKWQVEQIVLWLGALTGEIPVEYVREPELPK